MDLRLTATPEKVLRRSVLAYRLMQTKYDVWRTVMRQSKPAQARATSAPESLMHHSAAML
jgi:hypothetical protein